LTKLDEDQEALKQFYKYDDTKQMYTGQIEECSIKFQTEMKQKRRQQKAVHKHCTQMLIDAERKAERESIALIEAYKKVEKHAYRKIEKERAERQESSPVQTHLDMEGSLNEKISDLQGELLEIELKLQDALLVSRRMLFSKVKGIMDEMAAINAEYNASVMQEIVDFNDKFKEAALIEHDKFQIEAQRQEADDPDGFDAWSADMELERPGYLDCMCIRFQEVEALTTALEGFKEIFENRIQSVESTINNEIKASWIAIENQITQDQHSRNRDIIQEIVQNTDKFRSLNKNKFKKWAEEDEADQ